MIAHVRTLYRVVDAAEYADIQHTGILRGLDWHEHKYFMTNPEHASAFAFMEFRRDQQIRRIFQITAPEVACKPMPHFDRGLEGVIIRCERLSELTKPVEVNFWPCQRWDELWRRLLG